MSTRSVTEIRHLLEPVTADPFVADLDAPAPKTEARVADLVERIATTPQRRIFD